MYSILMIIIIKMHNKNIEILILNGTFINLPYNKPTKIIIC